MFWMAGSLLTLMNNFDEELLIDTLVEAGAFSRDEADAFIAAIRRIDDIDF